MCGMTAGSPCMHYLVKWAGYPTAHSSWTPNCMCSKNLVQLYIQQKSRLPQQTSSAAMTAIAEASPLSRLNLSEPASSPTFNATYNTKIKELAKELHLLEIATLPECGNFAHAMMCAGVSDLCCLQSLRMDALQEKLLSCCSFSNIQIRRIHRYLQLQSDVKVVAASISLSEVAAVPSIAQSVGAVSTLQPSKKMKMDHVFAADSVEHLKSLVANLNPDCFIRVRGRDRKGDKDTVRLGCKHVHGLSPCSLQIYFDIKPLEATLPPFNIRRYSGGSCSVVVCDCCSCRLTGLLHYDGCHRFCTQCLSINVISEVLGDRLPIYVASREIPCGYCKSPLRIDIASPLLTPNATHALQNALCTIASLESEKITELRLRKSPSLDASSMDPMVSILEEITSLILPCCPNCHRIIPDFDGCCALQCGLIAGTYNKEVGCGAHVCAWCQNKFVDAFTCHQHVLECLRNPTTELYPPTPHPQVWQSVTRKVGRDRVWKLVCNRFAILVVIAAVVPVACVIRYTCFMFVLGIIRYTCFMCPISTSCYYCCCCICCMCNPVYLFHVCVGHNPVYLFLTVKHLFLIVRLDHIKRVQCFNLVESLFDVA